MGVTRLLPAIIFALVAFGPAASTGASPAVNKQQLRTSGQVLPAQHIVINEKGEITQILSNTSEDVMPKVYLKEIASGNERSITPEIQERYRQLVPPGSAKPGILYQKSILEQSLVVESNISTTLRTGRRPNMVIALSGIL